MVNIENYGDFKSVGKNKKKRQIILTHTSREVEEYLTSLKFRYNGKYDKIPNFLITKDGRVLQLLSEIEYSNYFTNKSINKNSIIISLENLGWLEKKSLTNYYINWKGSIYNQQVYEKKWRDFFFWDVYSDNQLISLSELCFKMVELFNIPKKCVGHNTKIDGIEKFDGIVTRSNFESHFTDLNPSFNFENFIKLLENEQLA